MGKLCPSCLRVRSRRVTCKQFVGRISVHRTQGIYIVNGQVCRDLFGPKRGPYNGCIEMSKVCCRIVKVSSSRKSVGVRKETSRTIALPFAAVRRTCGLKKRVSMMYFATGRNIGISRLRPGVRRVVGTTRCVTPGSGRTIVCLGTRTVFSVMSGLFGNVGVLI